MKPILFLSSQNLIIIGASVGGAVAIGLGILLYFSLFSHMRIKKQVAELSNRFEYLHNLLAGQVNQNIKRIENISITNLTYSQVHIDFHKRFKEVRDKYDATAQVEINDLHDLLQEHNYSKLKAELPRAKEIISNFERECISIDDDLMKVVKPAEDCRTAALSLKEKLRNVRQEYYAKKSDLALVSSSFERAFSIFDEKLAEFEQYVDSAHYDEANEILPKIEKVLNELERCLRELPNICVAVTSVIPERINSLQNQFEVMTNDRFPLQHLIKMSDIEGMREEVKALGKRAQNFDINGVQQQIDALLARIEDYFNSFDKEKDDRHEYESREGEVYAHDKRIEYRFIQISNSLEEIRKIYVIPSAEMDKVRQIHELINTSSTTRRGLDTLLHCAIHQPYSTLLQRLNLLSEQNSETDLALKDFERYLRSLKDDSESAYNCLSEYDEKVHQSELLVRKIGIEAVYAKFSPKINELYAVIDEIKDRLKAPIDVAKVDELSSKLHFEGDELYRQVCQTYQEMIMADASIVYGNRERPNLSEINLLMHQAEQQYWAGNFDSAYKIAINAAGTINPE